MRPRGTAGRGDERTVIGGELVARGDPGYRLALAVLVLVALAPLAYVPGFMLPYVVPRAVLVRIGIGIGTGLLLWRTGARASTTIDGGDPILWSLVAVTAISVLAGLAGPAPHHSFFGDFERMWGGIQWVYLTLLYLLLRSVAGDAGWRLLLRVTLYVAAAVALLVVVELATEAAYPWRPSGQPMTSTLGNPGYLGGYMLLASAVAVLVARQTEGAARSVAVGSVALGLFGTVLALSGIRAALLGAALGGAAGLAVLFLHRSGQWRKSGAWLGVGVVGLAAGLAGTWLLAPDAVLAIPVVREIAGFDPSAGSIAARLGAWRAGLEGLAERPLLGWGTENFDLAYSRYVDPAMHRLELNRIDPGSLDFDRAHNVLVGMAVESGPAGLAAYLALWGSIFGVWARAWLDDRLDPVEAAALLAALSGYFVYLQFWFEDHSTALLLITLAAYVRYRRSGTPLFRAQASGGRSAGRTALWGTAALGVAGVALWLNGQAGLASRRMYQANAAEGLPEKVERYEAARRLHIPEQRSIAVEYASAMANLGLRNAHGLRQSESLRSVYSRGVEGADRALAPVARRSPMHAGIDVARGRLAAGAGMVFAGEGVQRTARESLRRAIEKAPPLLEHRHTLANIEALFGNLPAAREVLGRALEVYDGYGRTYYLLSRMRRPGASSAALRRLRQSFWLGHYPEDRGHLRGTVATLVERGQARKAERLLRVYVASRYPGAPVSQGDSLRAERKAFLENLTAEVAVTEPARRSYTIPARDLAFVALWPRAALAAGDCRRAVLATEVLLDGLSERRRTASLRPVLSRQASRLQERCRENE